MWTLIGIFVGLFIVLVLVIILYRKYWKFPLDTAESRRQLFPVTDSKRSHTTIQISWHPELNITKKSDGLVDVERVENNLHCERGYYTTKEGGVQIFWQSYRPKRLEDVTKALVMLHGYSDHCDYSIRQHAMTWATLNNTWVFTLDYPGHGRSDGLWALIEDWGVLIGQIAEVVDNIFIPEVQKIQTPLFCWGGSQGGAVAIHLCMSRPDLFLGALLISPMCGFGDDVKPSPCAIKCLTCVSKLLGWLPVVPGRDHSTLIFEDQEIYESVDSGPQCNKLNYRGKPRLATGRELLRATLEIGTRSKSEMTTAFLVVHGDNDALCPIEETRKFYDMAPVEDKMFKEIPGGWHAIIEHDVPGIHQLLFDWVNKRLDIPI